MMISIYATVFNNSNRVASSLDSIINQLPDFNENFEMVIVDNFSTDGTWEILQEYADRYSNITIFQLECKRGTGRQKAFEMTSGEYVFSVDLDSI